MAALLLAAVHRAGVQASVAPAQQSGAGGSDASKSGRICCAYLPFRPNHSQAPQPAKAPPCPAPLCNMLWGAVGWGISLRRMTAARWGPRRGGKVRGGVRLGSAIQLKSTGRLS